MAKLIQNKFEFEIYKEMRTALWPFRALTMICPKTMLRPASIRTFSGRRWRVRGAHPWMKSAVLARSVN